MNDPAYLPFARISLEDPDIMALPEEVRAALDAHKEEIHSAADLRNMASELLRRR